MGFTHQKIRTEQMAIPILSKANEDWRDTAEISPDDIHDPYEAANTRIKMAMYGCLQAHYPGHPWATDAWVQKGVAVVRMPAFTDADYILHLKDFDPQLTPVIRAGGEFLERYKIPRTKISYDDYHEIIARDPIGYRRHNNVPG